MTLALQMFNCATAYHNGDPHPSRLCCVSTLELEVVCMTKTIVKRRRDKKPQDLLKKYHYKATVLILEYRHTSAVTLYVNTKFGVLFSWQVERHASIWVQGFNQGRMTSWPQRVYIKANSHSEGRYLGTKLLIQVHLLVKSHHRHHGF